MRAHVEKDTTVRTIVVRIEPGSVPDVDVTQSWHRKPRLIRPDHAVLTIVAGEQTILKVSGGLVLKSGRASTEVRDTQEYRRQSYHTRDRIDEAPSWAHALWNEAPRHVTSWRDPAPEEVQAL
jgi:hypothetical protein